MWYLRYEPTYRPKLRTTPPGRPWVELNGEGWRPLVTWDLDLWRGQFGPRVVPGTYKVQLNVGSKSFMQELIVLQDPKTKNSIEDIENQVAISLELRDAMNIAVNMINTVEIIRNELHQLIPELKRKEDVNEAQRLLTLSEEIAGKLYDIHLTGAREDAFRSPMQLYGRLSALASDINGSGIDFSPTQQQGEVKGILSERLIKIESQFTELVEKDIKSLNEQLEKSRLKIDIEKKS